MSEVFERPIASDDEPVYPRHILQLIDYLEGVKTDFITFGGICGEIKCVAWNAGYLATAITKGWLKCDGSAVSRTTYSDLFNSIGTAYGVGDGSTTFNIPTGTNQFPMGAGTNAIGATGVGSSTHAHSHDHTLSAHTHSLAAHTHTSAAHQHTSATHNHNHSHGGGSLAFTLNNHNHDMDDHRHIYQHNHTIVHNHGASTAGDGAFSNKNEGGGASFSKNDSGHIHTIPDESGSTRTGGGTAGFGDNQFTVSPSDSDDGYTSPGVTGHGGSPNASKNTTGAPGSNSTGATSGSSASDNTDTTPSDTGSTTPGVTGGPSSTNSGTPSIDLTDNDATAFSTIPPAFIVTWVIHV